MLHLVVVSVSKEHSLTCLSGAVLTDKARMGSGGGGGAAETGVSARHPERYRKPLGVRNNLSVGNSQQMGASHPWSPIIKVSMTSFLSTADWTWQNLSHLYQAIWN